jgi:hypothetical protein
MKTGDVRVDRKTKLGNPFVIRKDGNREEVISQYRKHLSSLLIEGYKGGRRKSEE